MVNMKEFENGLAFYRDGYEIAFYNKNVGQIYYYNESKVRNYGVSVEDNISITDTVKKYTNHKKKDIEKPEIDRLCIVTDKDGIEYGDFSWSGYMWYECYIDDDGYAFGEPSDVEVVSWRYQ